MAIGINWKEVWVEAVWTDVWRQTAPIPQKGGDLFGAFHWMWTNWRVT